MSKETSTLENAVIVGNLTVVSNPNTVDLGPGNIECEGTVYVDNINQNTSGLGVNVENINFFDNYYTILNSSEPATPSTLEHTFYIDNNFLKSKNSDGIIKIYNPLSNLGDLLTHNGVTDIVIPLGTTGQVLTANSITGISWQDSSVIATTTNTIKNIFTLIDSGSSNSSFIVPEITGSYFLCISPLCNYGSSTIIFTSKSTPNVYGHTFYINRNPSLSSSGLLNSIWIPYKSIEIYKEYSEGKGDYVNNSNYTFNGNSISLSGTSWISLGSIYNVTTGAFCISISSTSDGPCATYILCKSDPLLNTSSSFRITMSPSTLGTIINIRWLASSGIEISKSTISDDGIYNIKDNFQQITTTSISLLGTSSITLPKSFFKFYENISFIMRIYSNISNSPKSIFLMSKNSYTLSGSKSSVNSPGKTTLEKLNLNWNSNSLLSINKDNTNYDGTYIINISKF